MNFLTDERMKKAGLLAGTVLRQSGNMGERTNQDRFFSQAGIPSGKMVRFHQIHSDKIITVNGEKQASALLTSPFRDADGWVCNGSGFGVIILTADCVPLFVWNEDGTHFALSHCGWRGVASRLPFKTIQTLQENGARPPFFVWAGPHIQSCCFEVQTDTACQFSPKNVFTKNGKQFVNLNGEIQNQLLQAGVKEENMAFSKRCTCCKENDFFSWRRDHVKNLLLSFMYKPATCTTAKYFL